MILRPYQEDALRIIPQKLDSNVNRQLVTWPTGLGKTVLFSKLPSSLTMRGRMLVLVDQNELALQAMDKLRMWNPGHSVGLEMAEYESQGEQLVVASVQTIGRSGSNRIRKFHPQRFDAVVVDETHKICTPTYRNVIQYFRVLEDKKRLLLGVTATANRTDGQGLDEFYQEIVHDYPFVKAIQDGWLAPPRGVRVTTGVSIESVHTQDGDFRNTELSHSVNTPQRNDLIARTWLEKGQDRQTLVYAVDVAHAKSIATAMKAYGISAEAVWGNDPCRSTKLKAHRAGHLKVLVNCQLLTTGYDDWRVSCIMMARPTKSELLYRQILGRGLRIQDDFPSGVQSLIQAAQAGVEIAKTDCVVIDFVDVCGRHSLTTLPSLVGLDRNLDMQGLTVIQAMSEAAKPKVVPNRQPTNPLPESERLKAHTQEFDLFDVKYAPEVIEISRYQWHKTGANCYILLLTNGDSVGVMMNSSGRWWVGGSCMGEDIYMEKDTFTAAIMWADREVRRLGGTGLISIVLRKAVWHDLEPTSGQLRVANQLKIPVPDGMTKGQLHKKITEVLAQKQEENDRLWNTLHKKGTAK